MLKEQTYSEFKKWLKGFYGRGYGTGIYNHKHWFSKVQTQHRALRKMFGDASISFEVTPGKGTAAQLMECRRIADVLQKTMGARWRAELGITYRDLIKPTLPNGVKTTRGILRLAQRRGLDLAQRLVIERLLAQIGQAANNNIKGQTYEVILSTCARSFAVLGNVAADRHSSCWSNGHGNEIHKYRLGTVKNSFAGFVRAKDKGEDEMNADQAIARFWGICNPTSKYLFISNMYGRMGRSSITHLVEEASKQLFKTEEVYKKQRPSYGRGGGQGIWMNADDVTFCVNEKTSTAGIIKAIRDHDKTTHGASLRTIYNGL